MKVSELDFSIDPAVLAILDNSRLDLSAGSKAREVIDWLKSRKCRVE